MRTVGWLVLTEFHTLGCLKMNPQKLNSHQQHNETTVEDISRTLCLYFEHPDVMA